MINEEIEKQNFRELINNELFPAQLLAVGEDKLYEEFRVLPGQFAVKVLHAMARSTSKWDTENGRHLLNKLNLTKADVLRYQK